ncbi:hypothetical protein DVA76_19155, partial [Acinetobacter baumannii]
METAETDCRKRKERKEGGEREEGRGLPMERKMRRRGGRQKARAWMSRTRGKGRTVTWGEKE